MKRNLIKRTAKAAVAFTLMLAVLLGQALAAAPGKGLAPFIMTAYAANSGACGSSMTWTLSAGTLTISGSGSMYDYDDTSNRAPWYSSRTSITKVVIESGVNTVGRYAFDGCTSLLSVSFPVTVTMLRNYAFNGCTKLNAIYIANLTQWARTDITSALCHPFYASEGGDLYLSNTRMTNPVIGADLTEIKRFTFYRTKNFSSVTIKSGVKTIGFGAFNGSGMKTLNIPDTVKSIEQAAFCNCSRLTDVYYDNTPAEWNKITINSTGDMNAPLVKAAMHYTLGKGKCGDDLNWAFTDDGVFTVTGTGAMYDYEYQKTPWWGYRGNIKKLVINSGAASIGNYAFNNCYNLASLSLPATLKSIGKSAFTACAFTSLVLPSGLASIGQSAFQSCDKLGSVYIPSGVKEISPNVFQSCTALVSVTLPSQLAKIGGSAFYGCSSLKSVAFPSTLTSIGSYAFCNCKALGSVSLPKGFGSVIEEGAFCNCSAMKTASIPGSVRTVKDKAFKGCTALTDVYFDGYRDDWDKVTVGTDNGPLKTAAVHCKPGGHCGDDLIWTLSGDTLTITGTGKMYDYNLTDKKTPWYDNWYSIKKITVNSGATYIGNYAFSECSKATSITIPESVKDIGKNSMLRCSSLTGIKLPSGLKTLGTGSFDSCSSLKSVTLPDSLTKVESYLFDTCGALESVKLPANLKIIDAFAFYGCKSLKSVSIPSTVTTIQQCAFCECTSLKSVTVPDSVKTIYYKCFKNCASLETVKLPADLTAIDYEIFDGCTALKTVYIPGGVNTIGNAAFSGCTALNDVYFNSIRPVWDKVTIGSNNDRLKDSTKCTIHCLDHIPGDINYDGAVDNRDLTRYMKYRSGAGVEVCAAALDTNGDGKKDTRDLVHLMKYLSGESVTLH